MNKNLLIFAAVIAGTIAAGMATSQYARAHDDQNLVPTEKVTPLLKSPLNGVPSKEVNILHITASPGFVTARHYHPGQLFIYVLEGAVTIELDGKAPIKLAPGDVFEEPPGHPMVGKNLSSTHGAKLLVLQIGDKGKPLTVNTK